MVKIFELLSMKRTAKVLEYFLERPTTGIHAQKLLKELEMAKKSLLDGLHGLVEAGVLEVEEIGRTKRYSLVRENPAVKHLKILLTLDKAIPLIERLKDSGVEAYLYGSAARGEDSEKSDIDLLIVGDQPAREVIGKLGRMEKLKPVYFTHAEYSALARKDKPFYERIEKDRIRLM